MNYKTYGLSCKSPSRCDDLKKESIRPIPHYFSQFSYESVNLLPVRVRDLSISHLCLVLSFLSCLSYSRLFATVTTWLMIVSLFSTHACLILAWRTCYFFRNLRRQLLHRSTWSTQSQTFLIVLFFLIPIISCISVLSFFLPFFFISSFYLSFFLVPLVE